MGKESKKVWIYVHVQLIHYAVQQKLILIQQCKSTKLQHKLIKIKRIIIQSS